MNTLLSSRNLKTTTLVELLQERLLSNEFASGKPFPSETELAQQYNVGRSTVRESVTMLVERGLLKRHHGIGLEAVNTTLDAGRRAVNLAIRSSAIRPDAMLEVRRVLEVESAGWAAQRREDHDLRTMSAQLRIMENPATALDTYIEADLTFHLALAAATQNEALVMMIGSVSAAIKDVILATTPDRLRPEVINGFHQAIYTAVERRDAEAARQAMQQHLVATSLLLHPLETEDTEQ